MPANDHVVGDMDQVVDFRALADDGGAERAAVNGGIGADLDIVVDDDVAELKHFPVAALVEHIAEAVRADDRAGVDGDAMAELRLPIQHDIREQADIVAKLAVRPQVVAAHEDGARAQSHPGAQDAIGPDVGRRINPGRVGDDRARDGCRTGVPPAGRRRAAPWPGRPGRWGHE